MGFNTTITRKTVALVMIVFVLVIGNMYWQPEVKTNGTEQEQELYGKNVNKIHSGLPFHRRTEVLLDRAVKKRIGAGRVILYQSEPDPIQVPQDTSSPTILKYMERLVTQSIVKTEGIGQFRISPVRHDSYVHKAVKLQGTLSGHHYVISSTKAYTNEIIQGKGQGQQLYQWQIYIQKSSVPFPTDRILLFC